MFSFSELLLILSVAVILLGKNEIPEIVEFAVKITKKIRALRSNFTQIIDQIIKETELDKLNKEVTKIIIGDDGKEYIAYNLDPVKPDIKEEENETRTKS